MGEAANPGPDQDMGHDDLSFEDMLRQEQEEVTAEQAAGAEPELYHEPGAPHHHPGQPPRGKHGTKTTKPPSRRQRRQSQSAATHHHHQPQTRNDRKKGGQAIQAGTVDKDSRASDDNDYPWQGSDQAMDTVHDMSLHIRNLAHRMSSSLHRQHQHMLRMIHLRGHSTDLAYPKAEQVRYRIGQQLRQAARCQHLRTVRANRADEKEKPSNEEAHQQERKQDLVPAKVVQLRVLNAELQATIKKTLTTAGGSDEGSTAIIASKVQEINK